MAMQDFLLTYSNSPLDAILFVLGMWMLIKGSDWFVEAAAHVARRRHVSEGVIGLTLVSVGTSLPELATNVCASLSPGGAEIAMGNVVGSNITNLTLILGAGALLAGAIPTDRTLLWRDGVIMLASFLALQLMSLAGDQTGLVAGWTAAGHWLSRADGAVLLLAMLAYAAYLFRNRKATPEERAASAAGGAAHDDFKNMASALFFLVAGLLSLLAGAYVSVETLICESNKFAIPKIVIAATVVALGTSLPELAVTVAGAMKGKYAMALGNILGSCVFNIAGILGASLVIAPVQVDPPTVAVLLPLMLLSGLLTFLFMRTSWSIGRAEGAILIFFYMIFLAYSLARMFG